MRTPKPGAENCLAVACVLLAGAIVFTACAIAFAGDDLPVQPPVFQPKGHKGPGVPTQPYEEPGGEDPRDTPPPVFFGEEVDARDTIVYVLDKSGSMGAGTTGYAVRRKQSPTGAVTMTDWAPTGTQQGGGWTGCSRWERAQIETIKSVEGLADNLRFEVFTYDCLKRWCFGSAVDASPANKARARAWVLGQRQGGGTDTGYATALGLAVDGVDAVVLLTDGIPECNDATNDEARRKHRQVILTANRRRVPVSVFGIGIPNAYVRSFCVGIANDNQGNYVEIR